MANQVSVSSNNTVQVSIEPTPNVEVTISRTAVGTIANVPTANYANFAGNVVNAAQPNITTVGTLTNLNVTGTTTTGNLVVLGNLQVGNLVANTANYANFAGTAFAVAGANVSGEVANANFATTAGSANTANTATVANSANAVAGANVSGTVANAAYADNAGNANFANTATVANSANSITLANVSGAGNIASINLDGNVSNVLKGDGTFGPEGSTGNANYANFAGNAFSVDGSNVVGTVANATFALDAGNANIANIAYSVDVANVFGIGNIATINLDGNVANALLGDGTFGAVELTTANYANFAGTVLTNAQPNITSVGTLTALAANTTTPIILSATNGNVTLFANNNSNISGTRLSFTYNNPVSNLNTLFGAQESGFDLYMANTAAGNVGTGNVRSYWQFLTNGDFRHTVGGSGNIIAKNLLLGNVFTGQFNGNIVAGNGNLGIGNITLAAAGKFTGNASGLTNIPGANVTGTVANATYAANAGNANIANIAYSVSGANVTGTVANATFALDAGNANIANIAYSVDVANVSGIGNIATINLDGNVSNLLTGSGTFVAIPTDVANANYANFAGTVLTNAQPNITSVGTLTALDANTSTPITVVSTNGNVSFTTFNNANTAGRRIQVSYNNPVTFNAATLNADENGFGYFIANTAPGNVIPGNIKSYWQFVNSGNLQHTIGGTGFVVAKGFVAGTGNVTGGNVTATGNVSGNNVNATANVRGNIVNANYFYGDGSNITNVNRIQNGTSIVNFSGANGGLNISTNSVTNGVQVGGRQITLNGIGEQPPANGVSSKLTVINGGLSVNQDNIGGGLATFAFTMYENTTSFLNPYTFYRARGNASSPSAVANGDTVSSQQYYCYADSGNTYSPLGSFNVNIKNNGGAGNVSSNIAISTQNTNDGSEISLSTDTIKLNGNVNVASGNVVIDKTGNITTIGRLDYLRTYGDFYSNVSQTNPNVANVNLMTFNNTGIANGVSIVSNSQMTIARAGNYNIQFSAQLSQTSGGTKEAYIWLRKNGSDVPYTTGESVVSGNGDKIMAAWNYLVTANVNDYFELAWNANDTSVILESVAPAGIIPGIASVIATVTPVGA